MSLSAVERGCTTSTIGSDFVYKYVHYPDAVFRFNKCSRDYCNSVDHPSLRKFMSTIGNMDNHSLVSIHYCFLGETSKFLSGESQNPH